MKLKLVVVLSALGMSLSTQGQGTILFNNRVVGQVDAPFSDELGRGLGAGWTAQLFLLSGAGFSYTPLFPTTTFRTGSPAAEYYVVQPEQPVIVPGVPAGSQATVVMRAWYGNTSYDQASYKGQSNPVTLALGGIPPGGGAPIPDAVLSGLVGICCAPEPSTISLALLGAAALLYRRKNKHRKA